MNGQFDPMFWLTAVGAAFVRIIASQSMHPKRAMATFFVAVFSAWAFTDAALHALGLSPEVYQYAMCAIVAITAENVTRLILIGTNDFEGLRKVIMAWRGKK